MISAFASTWKVPELRERILFTLAMIVIIRLGVHVTLPGVDASVIADYLADKQSKGGDSGAGAAVGAMLGFFSGGGLQKMGVFALGIMPYISASIMMQLMTAVVPKLSKLAREDGGREKINQYTRAITIIIALVQGYLLAISLKNPGNIPGLQGIRDFGEVVPNHGFAFIAMTVLTIVTGTLLLMWIGDQITDRGLGNGISLIITVNIISALPGALVITWQTLISGNAGPGAAAFLVFLVAFLIFVIAATIAITQAQRRIAVQYAKRVMGRKQLGGQTQYLPLKVNYAGVMPIIFATAILSLPTFVLQSAFPTAEWSRKIQDVLAGGGLGYYLIAGVMIFFFSYFWVATMFQPSEISENLKRSGGYIPGVRPGKPTADFLDFTMTRLTFAGAIFLTIIFILPWVVSQMPRGIIGSELPFLVTSFFGGTSLLIIVGVLLDFMRQVETHLLQRNYDGFLRKGKIKGRYDRLQNTGDRASGTSMVYLWVFIAVVVVVGVSYWIYQG
ncbi:preprotein translocase subunit SecY [Verrucomicrobiaceae bacterium R5-34]|uniref:Protein translocase subunit SecY n=1 Tax=Oceaniferula flava TaxID=2800421 RepID=A0AAE2SE86_9BACT|nr:preprotein translocase subunit SecY [Oceaniferula flavus]MBK1831819.1 preprotein translocase subunit SecY [Verrucomicrobiaceae bacterium R5-34]MBK1856144.1 preprotein translocase subunit SecY [Oceaniferula flavus]MBM1137451.1 preprotein translocase subunit SecY [Oceaniferula flavus]